MSDSESVLRISHIAEPARRYPGEPVTLHTRVDVLAPVPSLTVRIAVPNGLQIVQTRAPDDAADGPSELLVLEGERFVLWRRDRPARAGDRFDYALDASVEPAAANLVLESRAIAQAGGTGRRAAWAEETAALEVSALAASLRFLPAVYAEQDELMGRFLMLFESYWTPLDKMIGGIHNYLDPRLAPADLLPWLAGCVDLTLSDQWTEAQKRRLVGSALQLYRKRGTRQGLLEFLELYTGQTPQIVEHRANNLRLGPEARLAASVALGQRNIPHTFSVMLSLPPVTGPDEAESRRREADRRRMIEAIIEAEKPAHTSFTLEIRSADR